MTMLMQVAPDTEQAQFFDRPYWLEHCVGFRVDTADGHLGFVEEVRADEGVLVVREGLLGRRTVCVWTRDVDFVVPRAERIWLVSEATITEADRAARGPGEDR